MGRKDVDSGGNAEGSGNADPMSKTGEARGADENDVTDDSREGEELDERSTKRRKVGVVEG